MCTKFPYANRWLAKRALDHLRKQGRAVRSVHPCFEQHRGCWHVTSHNNQRW